MPVLPSEDWHASTLPIHVRMNQLGTWLQVVEHSDGTITKNTTLHILNLTSVINKILLMKYNNLLATLEQPSTFLPCYRRLEGYKRNKQKRSFLRSHQLHSTSPFFQLTTLQRWVLPRLLFDQSCFSTLLLRLNNGISPFRPIMFQRYSFRLQKKKSASVGEAIFRSIGLF